MGIKPETVTYTLNINHKETLDGFVVVPRGRAWLTASLFDSQLGVSISFVYY